MTINPFSYGRPVDDPARFIGRHREMEQIYSRILSASESTSIVGESRTGKTSLLKMVAHPTTQASFGIDLTKYTFIYQDFQLLNAKTTPTRFWQRVLRSIKRAVTEYPAIIEEIDYVLEEDTIENYALADIFTLTDQEDLHIILMLDEFENVTRNELFDNDFFGGLRSLAIHHKLALITSSRQDLVELTHSQELRSSPFFNIFATINLRAFSESEATELIDGYLAGSGIKFLLSELNMVFALAGYHPYFLQMAGYHLFAAHEAGKDDAARRHYLMEQTHQEAAPIFQNYWHYSTPSQQIVLMIMTMRELEKVGEGDTVEELERFYSRGPQVISELEKRNLVTKNMEKETYQLFSSELREWIADEIVGSVDDLRVWRDWKKGETMIGELPTNLQDMLDQVIRGLNPVYRHLFSNFLLDKTTAVRTMALVQKFVSRYEQYKETRSERAPSTVMAQVQAPVGVAPKGLFDRVRQQLDEREKGGPPLPKPAPPPPPPPLPEEVTATATGGRRIKRKAAVSPIALGSLVISGIITILDLDDEDEDFVNGELKWLFSAADNFLKIARADIKRDEAITIPAPPDAHRSPQADNALLKHLDDSYLQSLKEPVEELVEQMNTRLKALNTLLNEEASLGIAAKSDTQFQYRIKSLRLEVVKNVEQMAKLMDEAYGILVTAPAQVIEVVEGM